MNSPTLAWKRKLNSDDDDEYYIITCQKIACGIKSPHETIPICNDIIVCIIIHI